MSSTTLHRLPLTEIPVLHGRSFVRKGVERVNVEVRDRRGRRRLWRTHTVLLQYWTSRPTVNIDVS
jgi:hypothetical protein